MRHQVFKGLNGGPIPSHFINAASMAHEAVVAIFEMILHEENLQRSLLGMPHYFHIMIFRVDPESPGVVPRHSFYTTASYLQNDTRFEL